MPSRPYAGEMECCEVKRVLKDGPEKDGEGLKEHTDQCAACAELSAGNGALAHELDDVERSSAAGDLESMLQDIKGHLAEADQGAGRLRAMATPSRRAVATLMLVAVAVAVALASPRKDLDNYPLSAMVILLSALMAVGLLALFHSLRPLHSKSPGRWFAGAILVLALLVPMGAAFVPSVSGLHGSDNSHFFADLFGCAGLGTAIGLPMLLLMWALDRGAHGDMSRAVLAAASAGLFSNVALQLHCQCVQPMHLVGGHALLVFGFVLLYGGWRYFSQGQPTRQRAN